MAATAAGFHPVDNSSLRGQIEHQIRQAILRGTLAPGDHLVEMALAEQLRVSRAPVREALSALEREGIIINVPRRGYFVIDLNEKDIEEIYSLRIMLEVGALRRAIDEFTENDIEEMQNVVDSLGEAMRAGYDQDEVAALDLRFHELICQKADHSRLYSAWNSMRLQTWLLIGLTSKTEYDYPEQPREFHQQILNSILDKDLVLAETLLRQHILDAQQRALVSLRSQRAESTAQSEI